MSRVLHARRQAIWTALLLLGITVLGVGLAQKLRWRVDLTEESLYTLSPALVEMVENLDDRLQLKLYFNRDVEGAEHLLPQRLNYPLQNPRNLQLHSSMIRSRPRRVITSFSAASRRYLAALVDAWTHCEGFVGDS